MRALMIGDIVGRPGRDVVSTFLPRLREELSLDFVVANGENSAGGVGITPKTADEILSSGVDVITTGNHIWDKSDIIPMLEEGTDVVLRPH
ncbi:MAG: YmdB family metallophosphoesterase, partial [Chloroflexi bacterium]|nr:YmdB family metallophosphoesterase [Chloroflexota bacterium]